MEVHRIKQRVSHLRFEFRLQTNNYMLIQTQEY